VQEGRGIVTRWGLSWTECKGEPTGPGKARPYIEGVLNGSPKNYPLYRTPACYMLPSVTITRGLKREHLRFARHALPHTD